MNTHIYEKALSFPVSFTEGTPMEPMSNYRFMAFPNINDHVRGDKGVYRVARLIHSDGLSTEIDKPHFHVELEFVHSVTAL